MDLYRADRDSDWTIERVQADTFSAEASGARGTPTFFVGNEMFFGQDRLDFVREALA